MGRCMQFRVQKWGKGGRKKEPSSLPLKIPKADDHAQTQGHFFSEHYPPPNAAVCSRGAVRGERRAIEGEIFFL